MTESGPDPQAIDVADAVSYVCAHLPEIRGLLESHGSIDVLDRLLTALRDDRDPAGLVRVLHQVLQRCGDPVGLSGTVRGLPGSAGLGDPRHVEVAFFCPTRRCSRSWYPDPDARQATPPWCQVDEMPLRWERLL
jgi:hypothetical protein